jgi:hypothetical protein
MLINAASRLAMINNIASSAYQSVNFGVYFIDRRNADTTRASTA